MVVRDRIIDFICREILFNEKARMPGPDDPLIGSKGVVDSFGLNQLIVFIEQDLEIKVDDLEIIPENFETLAALFLFIESKHEGSQA